MSEKFPDATPRHQDGARIMQPFAFTTGNKGDFRPVVEKVEDDNIDEKNKIQDTAGAQAPEVYEDGLEDVSNVQIGEAAKPEQNLTAPVGDTGNSTGPEVRVEVPKDSSVQEPAASPQTVPTVDEFDKQIEKAQSVPVGTDSQNDLQDTSAPPKGRARQTIAEKANATKKASTDAAN